MKEKEITNNIVEYSKQCKCCGRELNYVYNSGFSLYTLDAEQIEKIKGYYYDFSKNFREIAKSLKAPKKMIIDIKGNIMQFFMCVGEFNFTAYVDMCDAQNIEDSLLEEIAIAYYDMFPEGCPKFLLLD